MTERIKLVNKVEDLPDHVLVYLYEDGSFMRREYDGLTPNGNPIHGVWVLRERFGKFIDYDQYRNDLAPRHNREI